MIKSKKIKINENDKFIKNKYYQKKGKIVKYECKDDGFLYYENGNIMYKGEYKNNKCEGRGIFYYDNSNIMYKGEFKNDKYEGQGIYYYKNGNIMYKGEFKNGNFEGEGIYYHENGNINHEGMFEDDFPVKFYENGNIKYKGNFKNGKRHGAGKEFYLVRYSNSGYSFFRKRFEGHYKNGKLHGKGKFYNKNRNVKFKGQFKNGFFEGKALHYFENGKDISFELDYNNDKMKVEGIQYYKSGKIKYKGGFNFNDILDDEKDIESLINFIIFYEGNGILYDEMGFVMYLGKFKNGKFEGKGIEYFNKSKKIKYKGDFKNGNREGQGILYNKNGKKSFEGDFKNNYSEGRGIFYNLNGSKSFEGEFEYNVRHGQGISYYDNGNICFDGNFKYGKIEGKGICYYRNGNIAYKGEYKNNKYEGKGIFYYDNGNMMYKGEFKNDNYEGKGFLQPDNEIFYYYNGDFKNCKQEGQGILYYRNGVIYKGGFKNDYENGMGIVYIKKESSPMLIICKGLFSFSKFVSGERYFYRGNDILSIITNKEFKFQLKANLKYLDNNYEVTCKVKYIINKKLKDIKIYYSNSLVRIIINTDNLSNCDLQVNNIDDDENLQNIIPKKLFDFYKKMVDSANKIQKVYKYFINKKKMIYSNVIKIQKIFRDYIISKILYKSFTPFNKLRKLGYNIKKRIVRTNNISKNIYKICSDNLSSLNLEEDKKFKIKSPKRKIRINNNVKSIYKNKIVNDNPKRTKNKVQVIYKKKTKTKNKKNYNNNNKVYYSNMNIMDGNIVEKYSDGTYSVINNLTGQGVLYDENKCPINVYNKKCFINSNYVDLFLSKKSNMEENYIYLNCHGLNRDQLENRILNIIINKSDLINSIILNIGRGYHTNSNGDKLVLKKHLKDLEVRYRNSNKNKDSFFNNYPEKYNFLIKDVYRNNVMKKKVDQLLCLYLSHI